MKNKISIPLDHPRYHSLITRQKIVNSFEDGLVAHEGLIAHGRGEAFDYLLGERTTEPALQSIDAAAAMMLLAEYPVISVNGNAAALCAKEICDLHHLIPRSSVEVNLFYRTSKREKLIAKELQKYTTKFILGIGLKKYETIPELRSNRRIVDPDGIFKADVVFVPLEDGDRTIALKKMNKKVVTIDLNPLSRTSISADVSITDNIIRVMPRIINRVEFHKKYSSTEHLRKIVDSFDNKQFLRNSLDIIVSYSHNDLT